MFAQTKKTRRKSAVHIEAMQTPKKPSSSSVESSSVPMHKRGEEEEDVKEAYPFEKEYKDCAF